MKKIIIIILVLIFPILKLSAQTYCYERIQYIDKDTGVKSKATGYIYITFTRNSCYVSDKNGNNATNSLGQSGPAFTYRGESNGILTYTFDGFGSQSYCFSSDYQKANYIISNFSTIAVFRKVSSPASDVPSELY